MVKTNNAVLGMAYSAYFFYLQNFSGKEICSRKKVPTWKNSALTGHGVNSGWLKNLDAIVLNFVMVITLFLVNYISCLLNVYNIVI